ncbi:MAG TPA: hypothetical protein DCQ56_01885, partial [Porphyromonadaceae bacterium]|nr:hypothetical protein [Porphyromonadaceae bacterium]
MKKCVVTLVGALMCASTALHAHDFMVDGIAYNILSPTQVEVTYKGSEVDEAPYAGDVKIPASVMNDG